MSRAIKIYVVLGCVISIICEQTLACDFLRPVATAEKKDTEVTQVMSNWPVGISKIILNGKEATDETIRKEIAAIAEGGYLFNARVEEGTLYFGDWDIKQEGAHRHIKHPAPAEGTIRGSYGEGQGLLLLPNSFFTSSAAKAEYRGDVIKIAQFFVKYGMPGQVSLHWATREVLRSALELKASELYELASMPLIDETFAKMQSVPITNQTIPAISIETALTQI